MPITDHTAATKRKIRVISYKEFDITPSGTSFEGTGAVVPKELTGTSLTGAFMDSAGDTIHCSWMDMEDVDPNYPLGVQVQYSTVSSTTADTLDWKVRYSIKDVGEALATETGTALDTVIPQDTVTGAHHNQVTATGTINAGFATRAQLEAGSFMRFAVELDALAAGLTEDVIFTALRISYVPRRFQGEGVEVDPGVGSSL